MKETTMTEWQITQMFLSDTGVHEVYVSTDSKKLKCNCEGFNVRKSCKHTMFVSKRMKDNGGVYPVQVSNKATESEGTLASLDPKLFRDFLLKYGKIEAL